MSDAVAPFRIAVPHAEVEALRKRLRDTRWPDLLPDPDWRDGVDQGDLRALVEYWADGYDWRAHEAELNRHPHFVTAVDGQPIHFIHRPSERADARPLILFHGWPSSIVEYAHLVDTLAAPPSDDMPAFHVVVPSLPGFGFSGPTVSREWGLTRMADAFPIVMERLGYDTFFAHGGDAGNFLASQIARVHRDKVLGLHVSLGGLHWPMKHRSDPDLTPAEKYAVERVDLYFADKGGYMNLQGSRPHALAYALTDSPAGQLAWIAEKFREWTDPAHPIDTDTLLTNVSIYWFTRTAGSSARAGYKDSMGLPQSATGFVHVPTGAAAWPHEISTPSRRWVEKDFNVVHWREPAEGGHFPALEVPELFLDSLRTFVAGL